MKKREGIIVFGVGALLLLIFTFADLDISMAIAVKPMFARFLEVVGEIPFTILTITGCAMLIRFRDRKNVVKNVSALLGFGLLFLLFAIMGGFMTWNYITRNFGEATKALIPVIGAFMAAAAVWLAAKVPEEKRDKAVAFGVTALLYFTAVILVMNSLKTVWGRMRFREMTDPVMEFTRWYQIQNRGGFADEFASFPSGHSMNSAGVILLLLFPGIYPALAGKENIFRAVVYIWCLVVGSSRVFMGAHFASDVTVGILISLALFELVSFLVDKGRNKQMRS